MRTFKCVCWLCCFVACILTFMVLGIMLPATAAGQIELFEPMKLRIPAAVGLIFALAGVLHVANCCGEKLTEARES